MSYIDNQPGQSCLSKGYGRDPAINCVMSFLWCWFGRLQIYPHFEWVPSAQNIADPISRFRFDIVQPSWQRLHLNLEPFWKLLIRVAGDISFATSEAVDAFAVLSEETFLVQDGAAEPEDGYQSGSADG